MISAINQSPSQAEQASNAAQEGTSKALRAFNLRRNTFDLGGKLRANANLAHLRCHLEFQFRPRWREGIVFMIPFATSQVFHLFQ